MSKTLIKDHRSMTQHSHSPLFFFVLPRLSPNSHFNTHTSASNKLFARRTIYRSVFTILLQEPRDLQYIYCIYGILLLSLSVPCSGSSPGSHGPSRSHPRSKQESLPRQCCVESCHRLCKQKAQRLNVCSCKGTGKHWRKRMTRDKSKSLHTSRDMTLTTLCFEKCCNCSYSTCRAKATSSMASFSV